MPLISVRLRLILTWPLRIEVRRPLICERLLLSLGQPAVLERTLLVLELPLLILKLPRLVLILASNLLLRRRPLTGPGTRRRSLPLLLLALAVDPGGSQAN
ncbi:MAG: hypothetical protein ABSF23_03110 [Terracidiphilus sp.]